MDAGRGSTIFPMPQIPALLFPPPQPPPPPPPLPSSYSYFSSASSHHARSITSFPILVLTVFGILTASVLLLAYYVLIIRCCLKWHHHSSPSDAAGHRGRRQPATSGTSSLPVSGAPPAEPRGLEQAVIQALPAFRYRKKAIIKNATAAADSAPTTTSECAVCLGEFEDEERVRMLPACLHVFHVDCIDTWLQGNANCPLCRAAITCHYCLLPPLHLDQLPPPDEVAIQVIPTTEQGQEASRAQQQQASTAMASCESAGDTATDQQDNSSDRRKSSNSAWRDIDISSKADECITERRDRDVLPLMRRSFSMGEMAGGRVHLGGTVCVVCAVQVFFLHHLFIC